MFNINGTPGRTLPRLCLRESCSLSPERGDGWGEGKDLLQP